MKVNVIIPCSGTGQRAKLGRNKILALINDVPVITRSVTPFACIPKITRIIIPCLAIDLEEIKKCLEGAVLLGNAEVMLIKGGATRAMSVRAALSRVEDNCDIVVVHDGARPYVKTELINECIDSAFRYGSGVACLPSSDTVAIITSEFNSRYIKEFTKRTDTMMVQTPQAFRAKELIKAYSFVTTMDSFTDDSSVYLKYIGMPRYVLGDKDNVKLTYPEDFLEYTAMSVGYGFDTHILVPDRRLILGGVNIPHDKGLLGHSDADVLIHAIMDALLAASGNRDIGVQFPDTDPSFKDADSLLLLRKVKEMLKAKKLTCESLSAVIIAEKPKLMTYIPEMEKRIARIIGLNFAKINITVTSTEGMGYEGREEAISARAVTILRQKQ